MEVGGENPSDLSYINCKHFEGRNFSIKKKKALKLVEVYFTLIVKSSNVTVYKAERKYSPIIPFPV